MPTDSPTDSNLDPSPDSTDRTSSIGTHRPPRRSGRWLVAVLVILLIGAASLELTLRWRWGLGTPLLYDADPAIEYLQRPNQRIRRFGNEIAINEWGMRSRTAPARKVAADEFRVLVLGDSVVNGGAPTDQSELATSLLERSLAERLGRPVWVGNVSAGSWGPPNVRAYVDRFGLFDADAIVVVVSSTDAGDAPTFAPLSPTQLPTRAPLCAISEALTRYAPGFLAGESQAPTGSADRLDEPAAVVESLTALSDILTRARDSGAKVVLLQHWELGEIESGTPRGGHDLITRVAEGAGVPHFDLGPAFGSRASGAAPLYRDVIHLNAEGQRALEAELERALEAVGAIPERSGNAP